MNRCTTRQSGVSLVEALVGLAVMAFGMLGLVGMQATMRANADLAKQRSEAVRIATERLEDWRGYATLADFGNIASVGTTDVAGLGTTNATYTWTGTITDQPDTPLWVPPLKTAVVTVRWNDRTGVQQSVTLMSRMAGVSATLGGSLMTPAAGDPYRLPLGRNRALPPGAVDQGDGTSRFNPPGLGDRGWVFSNATGLIVKLCDATFAACEDVNLMLLSGFVNFANFGSQPQPSDAENPVNGNPFPVGVAVVQSYPATATVICAVTPPDPGYVAYYCALPYSTNSSPFAWTGTSFVYVLGEEPRIARDVNDDDADKVRICRYTPALATGNAAHPRTYSLVTGALANQNFLVIRNGNDRDPYRCPGDDTSTPAIDGTTTLHQPSP